MPSAEHRLGTCEVIASVRLVGNQETKARAVVEPASRTGRGYIAVRVGRGPLRTRAASTSRRPQPARWYLAETDPADNVDDDPPLMHPESHVSHEQHRTDPTVDVLRLPAGATDADWYDAVTALVEADAYWALFPELVGPAASAQQPPHQQP